MYHYGIRGRIMQHATFRSADQEKGGRAPLVAPDLKLVREGDRVSFVRTRAALRSVLASVVDASPEELQFGRNLWGKPIVVRTASPRRARSTSG